MYAQLAAFVLLYHRSLSIRVLRSIYIFAFNYLTIVVRPLVYIVIKLMYVWFNIFTTYLQEILLVLDGTTGLNMLPQAREFNEVNHCFFFVLFVAQGAIV